MSAARHVLTFVVLGALLYGAMRVRRPGKAAPPPRAPIVVDGARIAELAAAYARQSSRPPTRAQLEGLISESVDDELLYREARHLGLDAGDRSVRLRLVQKMRAVSDDPRLDDDALERAARALGFDDDLVIRRILATKMRLVLVGNAHANPPDDAELQRWLTEHRADYEMPATVSFTHVFLGQTGRVPQLGRDATAAQAAAVSQPFVLGTTMRARSRAELARLFGSAFADAVMRAPRARWTGPIASPYGMHLVRVDETRAAALPPLDAVRRQVRLAVEEARAIATFQAALARLKQRYQVRVDEAAIDGAIAGAMAAASQLPAPSLASASSFGEAAP